MGWTTWTQHWLTSVPHLPALAPDTVPEPGCQKNLEGSGKALLAFGDHVFLFRILTQTWRRHEVEHKSQHRPASGLEAVVRYYLLTCLLADTASQLVS